MYLIPRILVPIIGAVLVGLRFAPVRSQLFKMIPASENFLNRYYPVGVEGKIANKLSGGRIGGTMNTTTERFNENRFEA